MLTLVLPEFHEAIGYRLDTPRQPLPLEEHCFAVVQAATDVGASLAVRLAALLHDLGKPEADRTGADHAAIGAGLRGGPCGVCATPCSSSASLSRSLRPRLPARHAPVTRGGSALPRATRTRARRGADGPQGRRSAREGLAADDYRAHERFRTLVEAELDSPTTLRQLAVDGSDLIAVGFREGPDIGRVLRSLLEAVVDEPSLNEREPLLERARAELA